jgi:probable F420-dependent oxidoreductase
VRIGFGLPVAGAWAQPETLAQFAGLAEYLGYDSLWAFQRLLVPADDEPAPVYRSVLDPLISLGFAAAGTSRIRLGVSIINIPFVSPALLAKQAATVDVLSGGRLDLGLGGGWSPVEFAASGADTARRGARAQEFIAALNTLWADEVSEFHGEFYEIPPSRMAPKPVQRPGPPVLLGGVVPAALRRAGRLAAGWLSSSRTNLATIAEQAAIVRRAAEEAGRDPASVRVVCRGVVQAGALVERTAGTGGPGGTQAARPRLAGSYHQIRQDTAWLETQGVTEVFYDLNWDPLIGSPDTDPAAAVERAGEILDALAPGSSPVP